MVMRRKKELSGFVIVLREDLREDQEEDQAHCKLMIDHDGLWRMPRGLVIAARAGGLYAALAQRRSFMAEGCASAGGHEASSQETLAGPETPGLGTQAGDGQWGRPGVLLLADSSSPGS